MILTLYLGVDSIEGNVIKVGEGVVRVLLYDALGFVQISVTLMIIPLSGGK